MTKTSYPQCLIDSLAAFGQRPTFNLEWDRCLLRTLQSDKSGAATNAAMQISAVIKKTDRDISNEHKAYPDLADPGVFDMHLRLFLYIANNIVMRPQRRPFVIDDHNRQVVRFLLYYFNNSPLAETVFPERAYKLHKNILLKGGLGVGKTMLMQCFSEYLHRINSPRFFYNLSVTQMVNYYTIHNNFDRYTFNEEASRSLRPRPDNVCLNDVGLNDDKVFYGMRTSVLTDEFLLARNDIWAALGKFAHITTNLDEAALTARFTKGDQYGRLVDRFKTYNVIELTGSSRR